MRSLRVLVLVHEDHVPPSSLEGLSEAEIFAVKTELDVMAALEDLGHEARALGVRDELRPIQRLVAEWRPHIVFNLLEEFRGEAIYDQNVVGFLELLRTPYTGCNPRGLVLARDKALSKKLLTYHRIRCPRFFVCRRDRALRRPRGMEFPLIVKSLVEEASLGISKASVVRNDERLAERVRLIHERIQTDAIIEQFVPGRELYVGVIGNERLAAFPPLELTIRSDTRDDEFIATERVKHDPVYQQRHGVSIRVARGLPEGLPERLARTSKRIFRILELSGYARIDFRLDPDDRLFFLEANPNPEVADAEELAQGAKAAGLSYEALIQKLLNLGMRRAR